MSDVLTDSQRDRSQTPRRPSRRSARRRTQIVWFAGGVVLVLAVVWWATRTSPTGVAAGTAPAVPGSMGPCSTGRALYVAPQGSAQGDGSLDRPWDLQTALSTTSAIKPCDTIWLRGGTYRGTFVSAVSGQEGAPVIVRQMPGERATIDSGPTQQPALLVTGSWAWFWDFEIANSDPMRTSVQTTGWPSDLRRGSGVVARGSHLKFINLVVHDLTRGFEIGSESIDTEVYGSLVYFNGWEGPNKAAGGHGIDTHNRVGVRRLIDNIVFDQFSHGIIAYASDTDPTHNMTLEGNILFNNGALSQSGSDRDVLIGGGSVAQKPVLRSNVTYGTAQVLVGYGAGCVGATVTDNYFMGPFALTQCDAVVSKNTVHGAPPDLVKKYPDNTYLTGPPTGTVVRIRPNQYEPGRANVAIFNWDKRSEVEIDLSGVGLVAGTAYEIRDAQNFFGPSLVKQVFAGPKIVVPVGSLSPASPIGKTPRLPSHTSPEFLALVVVPIPAPGASPP